MQRTPEKCIVPKFHQNLTNGSKVKSKKLFLAFFSIICDLGSLSLGMGQMCIFANRNALLLNFDNWITGF